MGKRLIDGEKVIGDLTAMKTQLGVNAILIDAMIDGLKRQPNVDAVEVVRCKDCKHSWIHPCGYIHCRRSGLLDHDMTFAPDAFCSYGERRSDNAAD
ncbi:MAG: hypothetical protein ACI3XQ_06030 [Eubacteriales bacterium]